MRRYYIVSGILLILPIVDFALAAPVLVQEKRQAGIDVVRIPGDTITMLGRGGDDLDELIVVLEDHFAKPKSSASRPSSSSPPSGSDHGWTDVGKPEPLPSESEYELVGAHGPPNPGPATGSDHELTGVHAPLSSPVSPTWFLTDHGYMGPHAPLANSDNRLVVEEPPSRPASPTGPDADHGYQVVHPPPQSPAPASLTESDHEMVHVPPSSPVSSKNPNRRSMGAGSRLENIQAVSDLLKGNTKESRRISGTARDVLNAPQRELQHERSLDPEE